MTGGRLEDRPRYTPTTTFETFPFPQNISDERKKDIVAAAKKLDRMRETWLFPKDMVERRQEVVSGFPERLVPLDASAALEMRTRTITSLYNQKPKWLAEAHEELDSAVASAYGWPTTISLENALEQLFDLNKGYS